MTTKDIKISNLPVEVTEHILSFLPLSDRKSASLVCRLWSELSFNRRAMRNVVLNLNKCGSRSQLNRLRDSTRRYRNLHLVVMSCCEYYHLIIEVLDRFGTDVESFHCMMNFTEEQLWNVVMRAPNLQQMVIGLDPRTFNQRRFNFPELRHLRDLRSLCNMLQIRGLNAPNLTQVSTNFICLSEAVETVKVLQQLAPKLKRLELFSMNYLFPIDLLHFPYLEILKLSGKICEGASDSTMSRFFNGFNFLKEIRLDFEVKEQMLDIITKSCPGIEKLHLMRSLFDSADLSSLFSYLERLQHLKSLSFVGNIDSHITLKSKPLVSVKELCLTVFNGNGDANIIDGLRPLLPNVTDVSVTVWPSSRPECVLEHICRSFSHIKRLTIANTTSAMECCKLLNLRHLDRLEELFLMFFPSPVQYMPPNKDLRRLKFKDCNRMNDEDLLALSEMYPNLQYLEYLVPHRKAEVTLGGMNEFKSRLPSCVIHCDQTKLQDTE